MCNYCSSEQTTVCYEVYNVNVPSGGSSTIFTCAEHEKNARREAESKAEGMRGPWGDSLGRVRELWRKNEKGEVVHQKGYDEKYGISNLKQGEIK